MTTHPITVATMAAACLLMLAAAPSLSRSHPAPDRLQRGEEVMRTLNAGQDQPTLEGLRRDFPFLADAITGYALGESGAGRVLDHRTRQIAAVAAFAALGHRPFMKIHAGYALNLGVTAEELKEVVYLTTVHAGLPARHRGGADARRTVQGTRAASRRRKMTRPAWTRRALIRVGAGLMAQRPSTLP